MNDNFDVELFKRLFGVEAAIIHHEEVYPVVDLVGQGKYQQVHLKHRITGWVTTDGVRHRFIFLGKCDGLHLFQEHIDVRHILSKVAALSDEELLDFEFSIIN